MSAYSGGSIVTGGKGAKSRRREQKRLEAQERQERFDAEVTRVMYEQHEGEKSARYVVNATHEMAYRKAQRAAGAR